MKFTDEQVAYLTGSEFTGVVVAEFQRRTGAHMWTADIRHALGVALGAVSAENPSEAQRDEGHKSGEGL